MRSPAAAIAWEFRHRHRWGLLGLGVYLLALVIVRLILGERVEFDDAQSFAFAVIVPITATFLYFLGVFTYGLSGDLAARQSMYPARMFTLPVTTAALAGWPMLYGTITMALLWLATRSLAVWPADVHVPVVWPALLAASLLAWTQALTWMPYPLPGMRVGVAVFWLMVFDAIVMVALELKASEPVMLALLAPHVPLAYLVARYAVGRARRGDVPDWRRFFARREDGTARRDHFRSAESAQAWFEWKRYGRSLPAMVAIVVPFELALFFVFPDTPVIVTEILIGVLLTPPFMAAFAAAAVGQAPVTPFIATRPLSNAALIAAKLKMTIRSTFAAWVVVLIALPLALRLSGTWTMVVDWLSRGVGNFGMPRMIAIVLLLLFTLLLATWKQLVQSLYIGLSGRDWMVKGSVFLILSVLAILGPLADWALGRKVVMAWLWNAIPSIVTILVCLKLAAAIWIAMRLLGRGLVSGRALIAGALCWDVAVFALYALLVWITPAILFRRYFLVLLAILIVPLARLSAAPLALAWNRHR